MMSIWNTVLALVMCSSVLGIDVYRLPQAVLPYQYNLTLRTDSHGFLFSGSVKIDVKIKESVNNIILHSKNLTVKNVELTMKQDVSGIPATFSLDPERDLLLIDVPFTLEAGDHCRLHIHFNGHLRDTGTKSSELLGYFRVKTGPSENDWMTATTFQMIGAREAFPCWDEPHFKARFLVTLVHLFTHKGLSNMPLIDSRPADEDGFVVDRFENTPPMSSYLVAYHLTKWDNLQINADDGRPLRLWANASVLPKGHLHLDFARRSLAWLQEYTCVPEPMPKIDLVAVPKFPGALENWGDISFSPYALLNLRSQKEDELDMTTIAHELAHSWFGNLVSPQWWDSLWLSEGAATFFSTLAVDQLKSGKSDFKTAAYEQMTVTMFIGYHSGKPLEPTITTMEQLLDFPDNVYYHGFMLYNMLYNALGPKPFRAGIHRYLSSLQFDCATPKKLYDVLQYEWNGIDLSELMEEWTYQGGIPLVTVTRSHGKLTFTQERLVAKKNRSTEDRTKSSPWWVPITVTTQSKKDFNDTRPKLWFRHDTEIPDPAEPSEWLMVNLAQGLYCVKYDDHTFKMIKKSLSSPDHDGIPELMRAKLYFDFYFLFIVNRTTADELWQMNELLRYEKSDKPWSVVFLLHHRVKFRLRGTPAGDMLEGQMQRLVRQNRREEDDDDNLLRSPIGQQACLYGTVDCVAQSLEVLHQWTTHPEPDRVHLIPKDMRLAVYCSASRSASTRYWQFLKERALAAKDKVHRDELFTSLGCTHNYGLLYELLQDPLNSSKMTESDWTAILKGMVRYNTNFTRDLDLQAALPTLQTLKNTKMKLNEMILKNVAEKVVEPTTAQRYYFAHASKG